MIVHQSDDRWSWVLVHLKVDPGGPLIHSAIISAVPEAIIGKYTSPSGSTPISVSIGEMLKASLLSDS